MKAFFYMGRRRIALVFAFSFIMGISVSQAEETESEASGDSSVREVVVVAQREKKEVKKEESLAISSGESAAAALNRAAGGTNYIGGDDLKRQGEISSIRDALSAQPGVLVRDFLGGIAQPHLNIRGSGIQSIPATRGVQVLWDGLPTNRADGSFVLGILEPRATQYIEVYRGSNGLRYGATTLGGAVNFVSHTGYDAPLAQASFEAGSYDFLSGQISSGQVIGDTDYYASITHTSQAGYRDQNDQERQHINLNLGHKFEENVEARISFIAAPHSFEVPGPLSKSGAEQHPRGISSGPPTFVGPNVARDNPRRWIDFYRLSALSAAGWDDDKASLGFYWTHIDDRIRRPRPQGVAHYNSNDFGGEIRYENEASIGQHDNHFTIGVSPVVGTTQLFHFQNVNGATGALLGEHDLTAATVTLFAENAFDITPELSWITGIQFSYAYREIDRIFSALTNTGGRTRDYFGVNPKMGLVWEFAERKQAFLNVSRSFEPPIFDDLIATAGGTPNTHPTRFNLADLSAQTATTVEIGTRGREGEGVGWDFTFYHSWVEDELLIYQDVGGNVVTQNVDSATIHQGIEMGLDIELARNMISEDSEKPDRLRLLPVYNWSHFYFDDHFRYGTNRIAGIPEHMIHAELRYEHPCGFYAGPNLEWMVTKTPVDHSYSQFQDPYAIMGFRAGYQSERGFSVFADARNLLDDNYAASVMVRDRTANPNQTNFLPGPGFTITGGVEHRW